MKKYYYLYQVTNLLNGKIYIGVHRTDNLNDNYMGSGILLNRAYKKSGIENFKKEVLEFFDSEEDMYSREIEYVDREFVLREDTYNLTDGGNGGSLTACTKGGISIGKKNGTFSYLNNLGWFSDSAMEKNRRWIISEENIQNLLKMYQKSVSEDSIRKKKETFKRIEHQKGEKNSMFGKIWITNGIENTRINKDDEIPSGWKRGRKIEFINGNSMKNCFWITDGTNNRRIKNEEIPEGWRKGRCR